MTDTPTPQMTPEQRAATVYALRYGNLHDIDPDNLADQLEADGVTIATLTAERDAAKDGEKTARNLMQKAFDVNRKVIAERDASQAEIARLTAALATPDQIAALAAERANLGKAVEALRFYADKANWCARIAVNGPGDVDLQDPVMLGDDHGKTARAVLAEIGGA